MCWKAGVKCEGDGPTYASCVAENYDSKGAPGAADADAVLRPVQGYIDFVETIEQQKQKAPPPCRCVAASEGLWSGGGNSDVKKKNVPQVQKKTGRGPND